MCVSTRYSPLIGTVFSQRQQEKNIFRVDHTCCQTKYNNLRECTKRIIIFLSERRNQMSTSNSMIEIPVDTIFNTPTIKREEK